MVSCKGRFAKMYVRNMVDESLSSLVTAENGDVLDAEQPLNMRISYTVPEGSTHVLHWDSSVPESQIKIAVKCRITGEFHSIAGRHLRCPRDNGIVSKAHVVICINGNRAGCA